MLAENHIQKEPPHRRGGFFYALKWRLDAGSAKVAHSVCEKKLSTDAPSPYDELVMNANSVRCVCLAAAIISGNLVLPADIKAAQLLPDLIPWASASRNYMYGGSVTASLVPGKTVYRFNQPIPNIGDGPLELRPDTHADGSQDIYQRIYDSEGGAIEERHVGTFENIAPPYGHMFLEGIAHYRIREVLPDDGVGAILTTHEKISYALVDGPAYDLTLENAPPTRHYNIVSAALLGISVGWADLYSETLPGQWADLTGLADGQYWLETVIDPFDRILELDETNNTERVKINVVVPEPTILAGDYNRDGTVDAADYTLWRDTLGNTVSQGTAADGDGGGRIALPDYEVWKANFGSSSGTGSGSGSLSVPEPASLTLVVFACVALLANSRFSNRGRN
jgi:hypothetical protein